MNQKDDALQDTKSCLSISNCREIHKKNKNSDENILFKESLDEYRHMSLMVSVHCLSNYTNYIQSTTVSHTSYQEKDDSAGLHVSEIMSSLFIQLYITVCQ